MIKAIFFFSLFSLLLVNATPLKAQKKFHVTIKIAPTIRGKNILIKYDNGISSKDVNDTFVDGELRISDKFYSEFAVLTITYTDSSKSHYDEYFIGNKSALIEFASDTDFVSDGHFKNSKLSNATEIYQGDMAKKREEFNKDVFKKMNQFVQANIDSIGKSDSLTKIFRGIASEINDKNIEFVKKHGSEYYSFWLFKDQILQHAFTSETVDTEHFKTLLNLFSNSFSPAFTESAEGKKIKQLIKNRIATEKDRPAPNLQTKDIAGHMVQLHSLKGKFVLLDFWATWCPPCMAELPFIQKLRADYPPSLLEIISVSADTDRKKFDRVIKEKKMNWTHIYGENNLTKEFGILFYPTLLLVDKNGVLVFDGRVDDNDKLVKILDAM